MANSLGQHQTTEPSEIKRWKCEFPGCAYSAKCKSHLNVHFRLHDTNPEVRKPYACTFDNCEYRATQGGTLKRHVEIQHTPEKLRKFQCPLCPLRFSAKALLNSHIPQHLNEKIYKCDSCNFSTRVKTSLRSHVRAVHETSVTFKCSHPGCKYSTTYRLNLNRHVKIHDPDPLTKRPLPCNFSNCTFRAYNSGHMKLHVEHKHDPNRKKEHFCPLCSKAFYTNQVVRSHIRSVHIREKTFCCDKCNFKTHLSVDLRNHQTLVHEVGKLRGKRFKCEFCHYRTDSRYHLDLHRKSLHSSERKLQCDASGCQFKTNFAVALKDHRLMHETEPERRFPFACTFPGCDFRRRLRQKLKTHMQNHKSSKKRLKCPLCPNQYPDWISFNFHKDLMHKNACYRCPNCNYNARFKRNLDYHVKNQCSPRDSSKQDTAGKFSARKLAVGEASNVKLGAVGNFQGKCDASLPAPSVHLYRAPIVVLEKIRIKYF